MTRATTASGLSYQTIKRMDRHDAAEQVADALEGATLYTRCGGVRLDWGTVLGHNGGGYILVEMPDGTPRTRAPEAILTMRVDD